MVGAGQPGDDAGRPPQAGAPLSPVGSSTQILRMPATATPRKYDWANIRARRNPPAIEGDLLRADRAEPWKSIAADYGVSEARIRSAYAQQLKREAAQDMRAFEGLLFDPGLTPAPEAGAGAADDGGADILSKTKKLTRADVQRILTVDDLVAFFEVDLATWEPKRVRCNVYEQHSNEAGVVPLYQVRVDFERRVSRAAELAAELYRQAAEDMARHEPLVYTQELRRPFEDSTVPVLFELELPDPHIGMLAWGEEVGKNYDSKIACADYAAAVDRLLSFTRIYPVERILYVVGNDIFHVDTFAQSVGGGMRGGATAAGTPQDVDSRLAKLFTTVRRLVVESIDKARLIAPVDVLLVPGNHDEQSTYRLGDVLEAWYRNDPEVTVINGPARRKFYRYGQNALMFTHGHELKRQRDNLPLIFATECPPDMWAATTHREIHTAHNHVGLAGGYYPLADQSETRGITTRSLPALTPEDSWHYGEGYKHMRRATALVFRRSGGLEGLHEFSL